MGNMTVQEIFDAVDSGMKEIAGKLASGEIDGSGRFFTDQELAAGAATGRNEKPDPSAESPAA